ncbi:Tfp pilus assembly ATPase PilU [Kitasatospora sp. MAA4]|uniref:hypothetical protein n=1 Tax=Kitasatospora sp. MAA4 TaxID=3035093 RepID=UPI002474F192|nr:hypothetical protein [Kitasatospora sp. MAA4]MDH6132729.1 Tfp pilus assembly ATPase PilU [Kitasatospora sp. MAA4]
MTGSTTLASLTTLRLGGPVGHVLTVSDPADWPEAVRAIGQQQEEAFAATLSRLAAQVMAATGIALFPEPVAVGSWGWSTA